MRDRLLAAATALLAAGGVAAAETTEDQLSFVVVGHMRGRDGSAPHPATGDILHRVRALGPDLLFLTGDMIYGDYWTGAVDRASVLAEWERLDRLLDGLGIPVHRVPGTHEIHDAITLDLYRSRYGMPPQMVSRGRNRFILLSSVHLPEGDGNQPVSTPEGRQPGPDEIAFLRRSLADLEAYDNVFVFMHHVLWWKDTAPWWSEVHPILAAHKTRLVFSGDPWFGRFRQTERDGVRYILSAVSLNPDPPEPRGTLPLDVLSYVQVDGTDVDVSTIAVGEFTVPEHTPRHYQWSQGGAGAPAPGRAAPRQAAPASEPAAGALSRPMGLAVAGIAAFGAGFVAAWILGVGGNR